MGCATSKPSTISAVRKKSIPKSLKRIVWDTHFGPSIGAAPCPVCKQHIIRQIEFHCGHIVAEKMGGQTVASNLIPICAQCNLSMGQKNLYTFAKQFQE